MNDNKISSEEKQAELIKYKKLVIATIDYYLDNKLLQLSTESMEYFKKLQKQVDEHYNKSRLTKLKQWFRDLTEMQIETVDLKFNAYLKEKTNYDVDIFKSYYQRIDTIIERGKITTDNQFYDINIMINELCQTQPVDTTKIEILNKLVSDYEQRKSSRIKKRLDS